MKKIVSQECWKKQMILYVFVSALIMIGASAGFLHSQSDTIRVNEFMALNQTILADADGDYSDWIELYNATADPVNLSGWSLTDENGVPKKWIIPDITLSANDYLIIFASGKDRSNAAAELHTNFKLSRDGEYFALFDSAGSAVSEFDPTFPPQLQDISFGYFDGEYLASINPTPGEENILSEYQILQIPELSHTHGMYDTPFNLEITTDLLSADIYYTTNGNTPTISNGYLYTDPILIDSTTVIRAIIIKSDSLKSKIVTSTYLFLADVINQPNDPEGYPEMWGPYTAAEGTAIADYEMDPEITQDPSYSALMKEALLSIPTMSIVTDIDNFFSASEDSLEGGIYIYTGAPIDHYIDGFGNGWERPASVEFFNSDGEEEFQVDCGVRIQGGHSRRPEKSPKHSLRLCFRSKYGPSKLEYPLFGDDGVSTFNTITLRAGFCNSWIHSSESQREYAQYIRDSWAKDTQMEMGHPSGHGIFVHLYINGIYWGLYNPTERMDSDFAESYLGGNKEDFDIIKDYTAVVDGEIDAWNSMMNLAHSGLSSNTAYQRIQGNNPDGTPNPDYEPYVDVVNLIDYMILNFYGGNTDWDSHNWAAVRNRVNPDKGFKFLSWDAEHILESLSHDVIDEDSGDCPSDLFQSLRKNVEFRRLFADRVQLHCFNGGVLTPESVKERWMKRANEIDLAVIAESARWGDYRRDVHPKGDMLYTKNDHWLVEQNRLMNEYFPGRGDEFIEQLRDGDLYPNTEAPTFFINGELATDQSINIGDTLSMSVPAGTIYYTTDGTDPVVFTVSGGSPSPSAVEFLNPFELSQSTYIKAKTLHGNEWSALSEKIFSIPGVISNLKITEIHYHPIAEGEIDDREFEFIELKNTGTSPLDLSSFNFTDGISYTFPMRSVLTIDEFIVLASNRSQFTDRYGFYAFDEYGGNLNDGGEQIVCVSSAGDTVINMTYDDIAPWPMYADGQGYSLVPKDFNPQSDQNDPNTWRASLDINGSPGRNDEPNTAVEDESKYQNIQFNLAQNYPNPFNPVTVISWQLAVGSHVELSIYNILGQKVTTLVNKTQSAGNYQINWDATGIASGVYFYSLVTDKRFRDIKKMLLIR